MSAPDPRFRTVDTDDDEPADPADMEPQQEEAGRPPTLPSEFWAATPWLAEMHAHARSRMFDPDLLLGAFLARWASFLPKGTSMDTGIMNPETPLPLLVAGIAPSGGGKSQSIGAARSILPCPQGLDIIDAQLKTAEGTAEAFMGTVIVNPDAPKKEQRKERRQVRWNASFYHDEGGALLKLAAGQGATMLETLRTLGTGGRLGGYTANSEFRRDAKDYSAGALIVWQPSTVIPLLDDVAAGTPQRFLFLAAGDPTEQTSPCPISPWEPLPAPMQIKFPEAIRNEVSADYLARQRWDDDGDDFESHAMLLRCKLAALFATLRTSQLVDASDWFLAGILVSNSRRVVQWLLAYRERRKDADEALRCAARVRTAEACTAAARGVDGRIERIARRIAVRVRDAGRAGMSQREVHHMLASSERHLRDQAVEAAISKDWITTDGRVYRSGGSQPT